MKPIRLIETPQIKENAVNLIESSYTEAEGAFLPTGANWVVLEEFDFDSLGSYLELFASAQFENYEAGVKTVKVALQVYDYVGDETFVIYGPNTIWAPGEDTVYRFINYWYAMDMWNFVDVSTLKWGFIAQCVEDATSVKPSFTRLTVTENKGK